MLFNGVEKRPKHLVSVRKFPDKRIAQRLCSFVARCTKWCVCSVSYLNFVRLSFSDECTLLPVFSLCSFVFVLTELGSTIFTSFFSHSICFLNSAAFPFAFSSFLTLSLYPLTVYQISILFQSSSRTVGLHPCPSRHLVLVFVG